MSDLQFVPPPADYQPTPNQTPRPFSEVPSLWLKVLKMSEQFFTEEAPRASGGAAFISIVIYAIAAAFLGALFTQFGGFSQYTRWMGSEYEQVFKAGAGFLGAAVCTGLFGALIGFYLSNGLNFLVARLLGGKGSFTTQVYLISLFTVPLGILTNLLALIPCLGGLLSLVVGIFIFVLMYRAMKVTHGLTPGKTLITILWPLVFVLLAVCCLVIILVALAPSMGNALQNILQGLPMMAP